MTRRPPPDRRARPDDRMADPATGGCGAHRTLPPLCDRRCRVCAYDLTGDPDGPRCPECGTPYDADAWIVRGRRVPPGWVVVLIMAPVLAATNLSGALSTTGIPAQGLKLVVIALIVACVAVLRIRTRPGGAWAGMLAVTRRGVTSRYGFGRSRFVPWHEIASIECRPVHRFRWSRTKPTPPDRWQLVCIPRSTLGALRGGRAGAAVLPQVPHIILECPESDARRIASTMTGLFDAARSPAGPVGPAVREM